MYLIKRNSNSIFMGILLCFVGLCVSLIITFDINKPEYYTLLPLLPLCFGVCCILFCSIFNYFTRNLGVTILIGLLFVRNVLTPFIMFLGNYADVIYINVDTNTTPAILLICWENMVVFCGIYLRLTKNKKNIIQEENRSAPSTKCIKRYGILIGIAIFILIVCDLIAPQLMDSYRTIFDITDEYFLLFEDSDIVKLYGTTFVKKLAIVLGRYLARALILIVPAWIIIFLLHKNKSKNNILLRLMCFCACFVPFFFISGDIARSLIYVICLFMLYNHCNKTDITSGKTIIPLIFGVIVVISWWLFNKSIDDIWGMFSSTLNAYFSGVNIVSGGFNLPFEIGYSVRYFINDFTSTIPFGGTIFKISYETVSSFFNSVNGTTGQIPPTISMGNYYFGPILAPVYSVIFAILAIDSGEKLLYAKSMHPMKYIRLLYTIFCFSMGIIMYNIEITMTSVFSLILPLFLMEKISYEV